MKLKNIRIKKYKLLNFFLLKYKTYEKEVFSFTNTKFLDDLELNFKKALFIIYQYHIWNKKILFVGVPYSNNSKFLKVLIRSNHSFIPKSIWLNGLIGNKNSISKQSRVSSHFKNFLKIQTNPHLIVLFNGSDSINLISEVVKLDIPIILFGGNSLQKDILNVLYFVKGNFLKKKFKLFFQFLLYSILKKPKSKMIRKFKQKRK